jgi:hypothetical protein
MESSYSEVLSRNLLTSSRGVWLWRGLVIAGVVRLMVAAYSGMTHTHGDFYATLPGPHVRDLNPALWNSPDLVNSWAFQRDEYLYGPTQYLTLYGVGLFDTYQDIARFLLVVYGGLLIAAGVVVTQLLRARGVGPVTRAAVIAGTALYLPLVQAYVQREFETVVVLVLGLALFAIVTRRKWLAGAAIGYVTWFKFFPVVFLFYFIARGWWRAVASFTAVSAAVLGASHLMFDLRRFAPVVDLVSASTRSALSIEDTCSRWLSNNQTFASVRYGLCRLAGPTDFVVLDALFWATVAVALAVFAVAFLRATGGVIVDSSDERMRRMLEFSLLVAFSSGVFYAHYYYLAQLVIPINVLVYRYSTSREHLGVKVSLLVLVYLLLTAFVLPPTVTTAVFGFDAWRAYMQSALYLYGQTLLIGLLLFEYCDLVRRARVKVIATARTERVHRLTQEYANPWV